MYICFVTDNETGARLTTIVHLGFNTLPAKGPNGGTFITDKGIKKLHFFLVSVRIALMLQITRKHNCCTYLSFVGNVLINKHHTGVKAKPYLCTPNDKTTRHCTTQHNTTRHGTTQHNTPLHCYSLISLSSFADCSGYCATSPRHTCHTSACFRHRPHTRAICTRVG